MEKTINFLKEAQTFYLATINNNKPEIRPFGAISCYNGKLYIMTGAKKDVAKQIELNNNVAISAMCGGNWIRISTTLIKDEDINAKKAMLDQNPNLRNMYNENDSNMVVYYFKNTKSTFCSFTSNPFNEEF